MSLSIVALCLAGCGGGKLFKPTELPNEFLVPHTENAQTIDLSRLASYSVNSNVIDRGDVIEVNIETGYGAQRNETAPLRVADDGYAQVPLVGRVYVAGMEPETAERAIAAAGVERGLFRNPSVTVIMRKQRSNKITVIGAVEKPGLYELPRGSSSLLAAIVAAEGLSKEAGTDVEIRRPAPRGASGVAPSTPLAPPVRTQSSAVPTATQAEAPPLETPNSAPQSYRVNLVQAAKQGNGGYFLEDGDVVLVQKRDPQPVHVIGLVHKPGQFELPPNQDLHLLDVIALAGGQSSPVADKIHVIRHPSGQEEPVVIEVSLREAKRIGKGNLRLGAGDVVSVEQTPATILIDTLRSFVHLTFGSTVPLVR